MAYCGPRAVPYSTFMGWGEGWDPLSRTLAIEWVKREADKCRGCGVPWDDWFVDGKPDESAYVSEKYVCPGCSKNEMAKDSKDAAGTHVRLKRNWSAARWRPRG